MMRLMEGRRMSDVLNVVHSRWSVFRKVLLTFNTACVVMVKSELRRIRMVS